MKNQRGRLIFKLLIPVIILAAGSALAIWLMQTGPKAKQGKRKPGATLVEVIQAPWAAQTAVISAMGTVIPAREVELRARVKGEVVRMSPNLLPGGLFTTGDTILKLDDTDYRIEIRQLESECASAESEIMLERGNQAIAKQEYEFLGEELSGPDRDLVLRKPQLNKVKASLDGAKASLEKAKLNLSRTEITAPFNSVVISRNVSTGTQVSESTAIAVIAGTDTYWIEVSVPVNQIKWIDIPGRDSATGSAVKIFDTNAWGKNVFRTGRVIKMAAGLETQGRMATLLVEADDPLCLKRENRNRPTLIIDSYVRVEIEGKKIESAVRLDRNLIRGGSHVWTMTSDGQLEIKEVEIVFKGPDSVLVSRGILPGDRIIVTDIPAPVPGMPLRTGSEETDTDDMPPANKRKKKDNEK